MVARFMGCWQAKNGFWYNVALDKGLKLKDLKYDTDWNWIMQVVEKIEASTVKGFEDIRFTEEKEDFVEVEYYFSVNIKNGGCTIDRDLLPQYYGTEQDFLKLYDCRSEDKTQSTLQAIVAYVKWYNQQLKLT